MSHVTYIEAILQGLREEMQRDSPVFSADALAVCNFWLSGDAVHYLIFDVGC
ncbi:MAG: hypothetical protein ACE5HO_01765 [bacterium]